MFWKRPVGPTQLECEEHYRTQGQYRAWCHACIDGGGRADPHALRNQSEKGLRVVGVDYGYLWSRSAENARDMVEAEDELTCVDETHEMSGSSPLCYKAETTTKDTCPFSVQA